MFSRVLHLLARPPAVRKEARGSSSTNKGNYWTDGLESRDAGWGFFVSVDYTVNGKDSLKKRRVVRCFLCLIYIRWALKEL